MKSARRIFDLFFAASVLTALPASAGEQINARHVVELFTSQGCSSCPPANAQLTEFAKDPSTLALSYSVEYWDYLGWKDSFADKSFSDRQRAYARSIGHGRVYTPQLVVNGSWDKPRMSQADVVKTELPQGGLAVTLSYDGKVHIDCNGSSQWDAYAVFYTPGSQDVAVKAGENSGRTLALSNVVAAVKPLAMRQSGPQDYTLAIPKGQALAVIVQEPDHGRILSAASVIP